MSTQAGVEFGNKLFWEEQIHVGLLATIQIGSTFRPKAEKKLLFKGAAKQTDMSNRVFGLTDHMLGTNESHETDE